MRVYCTHEAVAIDSNSQATTSVTIIIQRFDALNYEFEAPICIRIIRKTFVKSPWRNKTEKKKNDTVFLWCHHTYGNEFLWLTCIMFGLQNQMTTWFERIRLFGGCDGIVVLYVCVTDRMYLGYLVWLKIRKSAEKLKFPRIEMPCLACLVFFLVCWRCVLECQTSQHAKLKLSHCPHKK